MKSVLTILTLLVCACSALTSETRADELHLRMLVTTGERSRDSSTQTTTMTVEGDLLVWTQLTVVGGGRTMTQPKRKEFKLSPADKQNLLRIIRSNKLLVTDTVSLPQRDPDPFFYVSVELAVGNQKGDLSMNGPWRELPKVKEERLYRNTLALFTELQRIMRRQDESVTVCATFFC